MTNKIVTEDWSFFNDAVIRRAKASRPQPTPLPPPPISMPSRPALVEPIALASPPPQAPPMLSSVPVSPTPPGQQPGPPKPSPGATPQSSTSPLQPLTVSPPVRLRAPPEQSFWTESYTLLKFALGSVVLFIVLISLLGWFAHGTGQYGSGIASTVAPGPPQPVVRSSVTQFKDVAFAEGEVTTGWRFNASTDMTPVLQYCYYTHAVLTDAGTKASDAKIDIETRPGRIEPYPGNSKQVGLSERQWNEAASKCQWSK